LAYEHLNLGSAVLALECGFKLVGRAAKGHEKGLVVLVVWDEACYVVYLALVCHPAVCFNVVACKNGRCDAGRSAWGRWRGCL